MNPTFRLCLVAVSLLLAAAFARADPADPAILDEASLFSAEAKARAETLIRTIREKYHFDVVVESLPPLPNAERKKIEGLGLWQVGRYFRQIGLEHAEKAAKSGLHVLFFTGPPYVQVTVYPREEEAVFSAHERRELHKLLVDRLRAGRADHGAAQSAAGFAVRWTARPGPDAALLDGLHAVDRVLHAQTGDPDAIRAAPVAAVMGGSLGLWLVLLIVRRKLTGRDPSAGAAAPDRAPALLGSLFGALPASWIYDRLYFGVPPVPRPLTEILAAAEAESASPTENELVDGALALDRDPAAATSHDDNP